MIDLDQARKRLERQLAELEGRMARVERDLDEPTDSDSSERAVQMEDDEALEAQAALITREIASTRRALERVESGSYGYCVNCGEEISANRLEARPESALCINCASAR